MTGRPGLSRLLTCAVLAGLFAGCHTTPTDTQPPASNMVAGPYDTRSVYATATIAPPNTSAPTVRAAPPPALWPAPELNAYSNPNATARQKAAALTPPTLTEEPPVTATASVATSIASLPRLLPPVVIREEREIQVKLPDQFTGMPLSPTRPAPSDRLPSVPMPDPVAPIAPIMQEPPIRAQVPIPPVRPQSVVPDAPPAVLPPLTVAQDLPPAPPPPPSDGSVGPIMIGDRPVTFDALSQLVDGQGCGFGTGGCSACGDCQPGRPCAAGGKKCEPYPDYHDPVRRFVGLLYENIVCPDPCYQPKWQPIADSAFFVDAARPINNMRFRWDYGNHLAYPDRGEFFFARGDGNGKGPKATLPGVKSIPYIDYHELSVVPEIAAGPASVAISVPYRSVNTTPFGNDAAGFADMSITAKSLVVDSELFLVSTQFRTYIPIGNVAKGLGTGHVSLEPGLLFGLRLTPDTFLQGQVLEWIPLGGDSDYEGAALRWGVSANHILWRPVSNVQLIGTLEFNGISFQDGQYTDPVNGPQKLSGQNVLSLGNGYRLFFGNTFDIGVAGNFGIAGKYMMRDQMRFEMRFRY